MQGQFEQKRKGAYYGLPFNLRVFYEFGWLRGVDLNHRPLGYEPNELPDCSTPHSDDSNR